MMNADMHQWSCDSYESWMRQQPSLKAFFHQASLREAAIVSMNAGRPIEGYSDASACNVQFEVNWPIDGAAPNWRETLICPDSGLNNRQRGMYYFAKENNISSVSSIYCTEQSTIFYRYLTSKHTNLIGSEYDPSVTFGSQNVNGFRSEDLTKLTLEDESIEFILSGDVLEHVPDYREALKECRRVLVPAGKLLLTAPFSLHDTANITRARVRSDGSVEHILPPEYHGDPVRPEGVLCYYYFGWELLRDLTDVGFSHAKIILYWSDTLGHLGCYQILIVAVR
jgi:SAM-dependent methyltransferase